MTDYQNLDVVKRLAEDHFDLAVKRVKALDGEVDLNYYLQTEDGRQFTLKISPPDANRSAIDFQTSLLDHLAGKSLPFQTPRPVGPTVRLPDQRWLRVQSWVEGKMLDTLHPRSRALRTDWGATAGQLAGALNDFTHPEAPKNYKWNPSQCLDQRALASCLNAEDRELAEYFWNHFEESVIPVLPELRHGINYNDAHEHNLLVDERGRITGVIDFGDAMYTAKVNELAIACAYAGMHAAAPVEAMQDVVRGFHGVFPLEEREVSVLYGLLAARLLITLTTAADNLRRHPDNPYLQVSARPARELLRRLRSVHPTLAEAHFRVACGWSAHPGAAAFRRWAATHGASCYPVVDIAGRSLAVMDLGVGSRELGHYLNYESLPRFTRHVARWLEDRGAAFGVGGYGEVRPVYTTDDFADRGNGGPRWRTTHLGLDVWGPALTPVYAPWPGRVHSVGMDVTEGGYGPTIILEHQTKELTFYTLYGHLDPDSVKHLGDGAQVQAGDQIAAFGRPAVNGGWPPHLHFQVMLDPLGNVADFPGVAFPEIADVWLGLCPDPALLFPGLPPATPSPRPGLEEIIQRRRERLGYGLSVSYSAPLHILRGVRQYLLDASGRRYLDTVNNVAHLGHEHPAVTEALRQGEVLNTNSRYLHEEVLRFAEELAATLPKELSVVHFVNSGSEANELALRMCETWSGTRNMVAVEIGYHGNTGRAIDVSSYKFDGKGGAGAPPQTALLPLPDTYRGRHRDPSTAGYEYATYTDAALAQFTARGERVGGFIAESILSCGGQIVLPAGYLRAVYEKIRAAGGLCIADEVQVGVGRVGDHFWGFELQGVVPDIVTIGKPIGNGHPLGAVVCTPEVAEAFANGMEYFNTFGGNPVSSAVGRAVLSTVQREGLQEHAKKTGGYLLKLLRELQAQHPIIGDVRGHGLFLGFELTANPETLAPAVTPAKYLKNRMRQLGFLMSTDGPDENVLKIKPPMCFDRKNGEQLVEYLDLVFREDAMRR
ncbi:aminotransferase class III-fold pyridoxal phosphate-dependent enzyme [Lewinella sp. W8]|uniref:aminotransferase class III-fold pyridoxal phosphate-dependent enzyme n=1 Tax=Lewinella sp. W8 TaxID=2528208 RepID=UPI0010679D86|nr:aminotransferase class III-fold pyridoxal phosphate-dependent enzyme [Lewinella sp. W8]MTB51423.1 aminotransferase class III-fold pyridoxal phosphate-dependent enzyme [Lewinella sp. W8]